MTINAEKSHQTALFIYAEKADTSYRSRITRLGQCVNGSNIKVDFYTVMPDGRILQGHPEQVSATAEQVNTAGETPGELAKVKGYNLVLQASPRNAVPATHVPTGGVAKAAASKTVWT